MAIKHHRAIITCWIFVLLASLDNVVVFAKSNLQPKPKGTVKSILAWLGTLLLPPFHFKCPVCYFGLFHFKCPVSKNRKFLKVPEDGDVIDCVDIRKQPAFDHPLIKDLKVDFEQTNDGQYPKMYQKWHKYGQCPKGTVPIRRTRKGDIHQKQLYVNSQSSVHEYAKAIKPSGVYQGTFAYVSLWNPKTEPNEFSSAQIWVQSGSAGTLTSLETGWIVHPERYHDSKSRLFIHWTNDNYNRTGCFDLDCPGFVQIDHTYALGVPMEPTSHYNGSIWESGFSIYKDPETGDWYLKVQKILFGYWPKSIIPQLRDHAQTVQWGGEILNKKPQNHHTTTQMGSGHFSSEGNRRATVARGIQVLNNDYAYVDANDIQPVAWNSKCYDVTIGKPRTNYKTHFYFGGPGYSPQCPS